MFRRRYEPLARLRELRLPAAERPAARAERSAERQIRRERDTLVFAIVDENQNYADVQAPIPYDMWLHVAGTLDDVRENAAKLNA